MKRLVILFTFLFFSIHSWGNAGERTFPGKRFVAGLTVGVAKTNQAGRAIRFPLGYSTFDYRPDENISPAVSYGGSLGYILKPDAFNNLIVSLSYHRLSNMEVNGTLEQGISAPFYSARYQYAIQLSQLLAEVKIQHKWRQTLYPYLTAGIGSGFNSAKNFGTTVPDYLTVTPAFANHTRSSLGYMLGLGMDTPIASNITAGIEYRFSNWGQAGPGNGVIRMRTLPDYLSQSHLYTNALSAQLNYYF
jgi:opacity protein-like surface antigen